MTTRTITMSAPVLALVLDEADRELLSTLSGTEVDEDIVKDNVSEETYQRLFSNINHPIAELAIEEQESSMTTTETPTTNETKLVLTYEGIEFECEFRMDKQFAGQQVVASDFPELSKDMLLRIATWQSEHISATDTKTVEKMVERQQQRTPSNALAGEEKLRAIKAMGLWHQLTDNQKHWLRKGNNWGDLVIKTSAKGFKVSFNHGPRSRGMLADALMAACKKANRYFKLQPHHVYVRMG